MEELLVLSTVKGLVGTQRGRNSGVSQNATNQYHAVFM